MDQELFNPQSSSVQSSCILYTPSSFARTSLLHLQEVGSLQAIHPHTSTRTDLVSFLCFVVLSINEQIQNIAQFFARFETFSIRKIKKYLDFRFINK